ncbi:unnamed protein product [Pedinophyceae sp. YPF-701]|nr:unnamed protein product [Pedinophyceae sp. YPF-701]
MGQMWSCVPNQEIQFVERCGKFNRTAGPGFNCVCCLLGYTVRGSISMRVQQLDVRCETKTQDNVFVSVVVSVQYQVINENLYDAFYRLTDPRTQITAYVFDVVRATVPKMTLDNVFVAKEEIANDVKEELSKTMTGYGYNIIKTLVTDIEPDHKVRTAMNEINAAQRLRVAAVEKAEAEKVRVVKAAEADAEAKFLAGQGIARQRQAIIAGLRESVVGFQEHVTEVGSREVIELMVLTQYMDTLKDLGNNSNTQTIFMPHNPGGLADVASQVRTGMLEAQAMKR